MSDAAPVPPQNGPLNQAIEGGFAAGGEQPALAGGEQPAPAGGEQPAPAGGEQPSPGGERPALAGGDQPAPAGNERAAPAAGAEGAHPPNASGTTRRTIGTYRSFREGQLDRDYGKKIEFLISIDDRYIVFLDPEDYLWWASDYRDFEYPTYYAQVITRAAILECAPVDHLTKTQRRSYHRLIGEGIARMLAKEGEGISLATLDAASDFYRARGTERARLWYSVTAVTFACIAAAVMLKLWVDASWATTLLGRGGFLVALGACSGGVGALASILLRIGNLDLDPTGGLLLHSWASVCRTLMGIVAATLLALGLQAGLLGAGTTFTATSGLLFVCMLAGASERLLPELVTRVDGTFSNGRPLGTATETAEAQPRDPDTPAGGAVVTQRPTN